MSVFKNSLRICHVELSQWTAHDRLTYNEVQAVFVYASAVSGTLLT